jgi:CBS domain-containing protein
MRPEVITVCPGAPAHEVVSLLIDHNISGLPVVDGDVLVGMVCEKDILKLFVGADSLSETVADLMTPDVISCDQNTTLKEICAYLAANSLRHLPVVHESRLVGMISRSDMVRIYRDRYKSEETCSGLATADGPVARDAMTCGLFTVSPHVQVCQALEMLVRWDITGLPVVEEGLRLVGVISERDLLQLLCNSDPSTACVRDLMTTRVVGFAEGTPLLDVCMCLAHSAFRRVPILTGGRLIGIISRRDLILYLLQDNSQASRRRPVSFARRGSHSNPAFI